LKGFLTVVLEVIEPCEIKDFQVFKKLELKVAFGVEGHGLFNGYNGCSGCYCCWVVIVVCFALSSYLIVVVIIVVVVVIVAGLSFL
jgi:L-cystine uptake protein TcyP (sodium:dicarboxylate symporter family)